MKKFRSRTLLLALIIVPLCSCNKKFNAPSSIEGIWHIRSDSTYLSGGTQNHISGYTGKPGDYFDFTADGQVYSLEDSVRDTFTYSIRTDSVFVLNFLGSIVGKGKLQSSAANTLSLQQNIFTLPAVLLAERYIS